jgi:hypothetical protein
MLQECGLRATKLGRYRQLGDRSTNFEIFGLIRSDALRKTTMHRPYYGSDKALMTELTLLGRFVFVPGIVFYNREHRDRSINIKDKHILANSQDKIWLHGPMVARLPCSASNISSKLHFGMAGSFLRLER